MSISISLGASRTSGVAPLAVFFDASDTTSTETSRPFHHLLYKWNFGDSNGAAAWTYGTRTAAGSKNEAYGPLVAHVFENAGNYTVTLTVFDGVLSEEETINITVAAWDDATHGDTLCVENVETGAGGPVGADYLTSSDFDAAINTTADGGAVYKRILFKRGDTFTGNSSSILDTAGPGIVGAYGTGDLPIINGTGSPKIQYGANDWRVMDLDLDGVDDSGEAAGPTNATNPKNFLLFRNTITNFSDTLHWPMFKGTGFPLFEYTFFVENDISSSQQYSFIGDGHGLAFLGNRMNDNTSQHLMRLNHTKRLVVSNNEFGATGTGLRLTVRAYENFTTGGTTGNLTFPAGEAYTEEVIISENYFPSNALSVRSQTDTDDTRMRHIIIEKNYFAAGGGMATEAGDLTFRNNLILGTGQPGPNFFTLFKTNNINIPDEINDNIEIFHNTYYNADVEDDFFGVTFFGGDFTPLPNNFRLQNNLVYIPNFTGTRQILSGTPGTNPTVSHNTTDGATMSTSNPNFVGTPNTTFTNWQIQAGSYAEGAGSDSVPVWDDFFGNVRDWETPNTDFGAYALDQGSLPSANVTYKGGYLGALG